MKTGKDGGFSMGELGELLVSGRVPLFEILANSKKHRVGEVFFLADGVKLWALTNGVKRNENLKA